MYYKTGGSGWKKIADVTGTSHVWTGAKNGTKYSFTVKAYDSQGVAGPYDKTGASLLYTLAAPVITAVSGTTGGVQLKWGAVAGAAKYRVYYKTTGGWKKITDTAKTSYTWTKAQSGVRYSFTIKGYDSKGTAGGYDRTGVSFQYVSAPAISKVENTASGIKVTWGKVPGASKYRLYFKTSGRSWEKITDTTKTSYTWKNAESGTKYTFTVRSYNSDGVSGPYNKTGKSATYIAAPVLSKAANTADGVKITWKAVTGAKLYRVYYKTTGSWKKLADTTGTSYTWKEAESGTNYIFTVRCMNADQKSYASAYDKKGLTLRYVAAPVIDETANTDSGSIAVTWEAVRGASKYQVYCKVDSGEWTRVTTTTKTKYTLKEPDSKARYTYKLRAVAKDGTESDYSEERKTMIFTNSSLVDFSRLSPNCDPDRNNIIDTITIHCVVGQTAIEDLGVWFAFESTRASSNYGIGPDGRIGMYVQEKDCSWCSSNRDNDNRSVTIEVASDTQEPYWVTEQAFATLLDLVTDICQRNDIKKLVWSTDKNERVNHLNGCNMTVHRDYANKTCPGTYLYDRHGQIAAEVNARLEAAMNAAQ